jgi:hypothetical protein
MIMLSWITKIKLELMAYEAMFATCVSHVHFTSYWDGINKANSNEEVYHAPFFSVAISYCHLNVIMIQSI